LSSGKNYLKLTGSLGTKLWSTVTS